jgi:vancomycin permeability regulator SanA
MWDETPASGLTFRPQNTDNVTVKTRWRKVALWVALAGLAWVLLTAAVLVWDGLTDRIAPVDVAVVLGNAVERGRPSPRLRARLDKAVALYRQGFFRYVIVSGGVEPSGEDEAEVMAKYLLEQGVPASAILRDSRGDNTYLTAQNAARIMQEHQLRTALVVSQYYHITRSKLALRRFHVTCECAAHAEYFELGDIFSTLREVVAFYVYLFKN